MNDIKLLIVEDNDTIIKLYLLWLETSLKKYNFIPTIAKTLKEGINLVKIMDFDVIILDLLLPESTFETVCKTFLTITNIPIIVVSGIENDDLILQLCEEGAFNYLVKGQMTGKDFVKSILFAYQTQRNLTIEKQLERISIENVGLKDEVKNLKNICQAALKKLREIQKTVSEYFKKEAIIHGQLDSESNKETGSIKERSET